METHKLYIRNMMCQRCLWAVERELKRLEIGFEKVEMGQVITTLPKSAIGNLDEFEKSLQGLGFELLGDDERKIVEQVKGHIIFWIRHAAEEKAKWKLSGYLAMKTGRDFKDLDLLFRRFESISISQYFETQRIEKAREMILFGEPDLEQISADLGYENPAQLKTRFRAATGHSPQQFKLLVGKQQHRKFL